MTPNTDLPPSTSAEAQQGASAGCAPTAGSPFRHINRDGYGTPWIVNQGDYKYAVMIHESRGYCFEIQRIYDDGARIESLMESFDHPSPQDADCAAQIAIRDMENAPV